MQLEREAQMTIMRYDLEKLVPENHELRKISKIVFFEGIARKYVELRGAVGRKGYGLATGIKCLFLQFYYDLSDREIEKAIRDSMAMRWFCGMSLDEDTPDHSFFCRIRATLGTKRISQVFKNVMHKAEEAGMVRNIFTFVDASEVKAKETTWKERDKAIEEGEAALNNGNVGKYSADKDARFGCKGKDKFWYGYKRHVSVDMGSGLIKKVAITPANESDTEGLRHICPRDSMVVADKGYCGKRARDILDKRSCHSGVILKNNMKAKNKDKDKWLTRLRAPFESVFSKLPDRARYRGIAKVQLQAFMEAMVVNVKRMVIISGSPQYVMGA